MQHDNATGSVYKGDNSKLLTYIYRDTNVKETLSSFTPQLFMRSDTVFYFAAKQAKQLPLMRSISFYKPREADHQIMCVSAFRPGAPALSRAQSAAP